MTPEEMALIDEKFKGIATLINAHNSNIMDKFQNVDEKLKSIEEQTKKTNGRVTAHDTKINDLEKKELTHVINCPQAPKIRQLEDSQLTSASVRKWVYTAVILTGTCMGVVWIIFKMATGG